MTDAAVDFRQVFGRRPKVAIGHPMLGRGGSEAAMMWAIDALRSDCDITVITTKGWNLSSLNEFYGTSVEPCDVRVRLVPTCLPDRVSAAALRGSLYQRYLERIRLDYDVRISAYNPTDWGASAIHAVVDFSWDDGIRKRCDPAPLDFVHRPTLMRRAYLLFCRMCSNKSGRNVFVSDTIVANSKWTSEQLRERCGTRTIPVIYPPVWCKFPVVSWNQKELSFVMIGRIAPEKDIERAIGILSAVREKGHDIKLHLCGQIGDDAYGHLIRKRCEENSEWIIAHGQVSGNKKVELLSSCKYGIQTGTREAFGIAVAEMIKAGALVFAPNFGGQVEIIDHQSLLFESDTEAVEKIDAVLCSEDYQVSLSTHLEEKSREFTVEKYMSQIRALVASHVLEGAA